MLRSFKSFATQSQGVLSMTAEDWGKFAEGSLDLHPLRSIGHWRFETDADGKYGYLNQTMGVVSA